jgi:hypothetical protein
MLESFIEVNQLLRGMRAKAADAAKHLECGDERTAANVQRYLRDDLTRLKNLWQHRLHLVVSSYGDQHISLPCRKVLTLTPSCLARSQLVGSDRPRSQR